LNPYKYKFLYTYKKRVLHDYRLETVKGEKKKIDFISTKKVKNRTRDTILRCL